MPSKGLHIATYTDATGRGGGEMSLGHLVGALHPSFRVTVLGVDREVVDWIVRQRPGSDAVLLPVVRGAFDAPRIAAHMGAVLRLRPDVLHVNLRVPWSCWYGIAGGLASPGTVTVGVEQLPIRTRSRVQRWWKQRLASRFDAHVAVGEASARRTEGFAGLPAGSVQSIPNYVPDPGPTSPVPHDGVVLAGVGRLDPQKGFDVLLTALTEVGDVRLVLVGHGNARTDLERQAARLGIAGRVRFTGWSDDVRTELAAADVVVLPSRSEGFPLTIVEAMLAGLPVVATDVGSVAEAVRDGDTGILVAKEDPGGLAAALRRLAGDPDLRRAMGERARAVATRSMTVEVMARAYEDLYERLHAQRSRDHRLRAAMS